MTHGGSQSTTTVQWKQHFREARSCSARSGEVHSSANWLFGYASAEKMTPITFESFNLHNLGADFSGLLTKVERARIVYSN
jgi:hypothetical protein